MRETPTPTLPCVNEEDLDFLLPPGNNEIPPTFLPGRPVSGDADSKKI
jgi:hypothetical protein